MRVTKELKEKVEMDFATKRSRMKDEFQEDIESLKAERSIPIVEQIEAAIKDHPIVAKFLEKNYRRSDTENCSPLEYIKDNSLVFFREEEAQNDREERSCLAELRTQEQNVLIQLSYGKNLDDIRKIFEENGLTF